MHCHNCEVPLEWDGFSPIVVCGICHSYRFTDVPDHSGSRIVTLAGSGECHCPKCRRRLKQAAMDGLKVERCSDCEGVLLTDDVFAMFVRNRRTEFRDAASRPILRVIEDEQADVKCPNCRRAMHVHPCYGPNYVIVDACLGCGMVWLDCRDSTLEIQHCDPPGVVHLADRGNRSGSIPISLSTVPAHAPRVP